MSSLLSIISAGRKRNLLGGLVDWWDSGLSGGQHSGIAFTNANYGLTADPFGGSLAYYAGSGDTFRPALPTAISALNPWTVACVFYRGVSTRFYVLSATSIDNPAVYVDANGSIVNQRFFDISTAVNLAPAGTVTNGWHSFVTSYASGVASFYLDGVLIATRSVPHTTATFQPAFCNFFRLGIDIRCAVGAIATRAWSLGDAISFHNSGSFKRYRDFSGFEPETNVYLARIVAAGSSISSSNLGAVNTLFLALKTQSIWTLISELYLFAGVDNLTGCLVKAKGSGSLSNTSFAGGDHNRTTGLLGNGSSKYLNTGLANNALSGTSNHIFVEGSGFETSGDRIPAGAFNGGPAASLLALDFYSAGISSRAYRSASAAISAVPRITTGLITSGSFCGTRTSASSASIYQNGSLANNNTSSVSPAFSTRPIFVFALNNIGSPGGYTAARLRAVSIGSGLSDAQASSLNAAIATYMSSLT
jgi:hypothetical protein